MRWPWCVCPVKKEEQLRAVHRQREQLVKARKQLEAQGRSLLVNHGLEPVQNWWKPRTTMRTGENDQRRDRPGDR